MNGYLPEEKLLDALNNRSREVRKAAVMAVRENAQYSERIKLKLLSIMQNQEESTVSRMFAQLALTGFNLSEEEYYLVQSTQHSLLN